MSKNKWVHTSKSRDEYQYEIYLYSEPFLLFLGDESIIDVNVEEKDFIIDYSDIFFDYNLKYSERKTFSIIAQTYNKVGQFLQQVELLGENLIIESNRIKFNFDQITNNNAWSSINPKFAEATELYKKERVSYLRDKKIDTLLK